MVWAVLRGAIHLMQEILLHGSFARGQEARGQGQEARGQEARGQEARGQAGFSVFDEREWCNRWRRIK